MMPSHAVYHALTANHHVFSPHHETNAGAAGLNFACASCGSTSIFTLGFCPLLDGSGAAVVCRGGCRFVSKAAWNGNSWTPIVVDRAITDWLVESSETSDINKRDADVIERASGGTTCDSGPRYVPPLLVRYASPSQMATSLGHSLAAMADQDVRQYSSQAQTGCNVEWIDAETTAPFEYAQIASIAAARRRRHAVTTGLYARIHLNQTPALSVTPNDTLMLAVPRTGFGVWASLCRVVDYDSFDSTVVVEVLNEPADQHQSKSDIARLNGFFRRIRVPAIKARVAAAAAAVVEANATTDDTPLDVCSGATVVFDWTGTAYCRQAAALVTWGSSGPCDGNNAMCGKLARLLVGSESSGKGEAFYPSAGSRPDQLSHDLVDHIDPAMGGAKRQKPTAPRASLHAGWHRESSEPWMCSRAADLRSNKISDNLFNGLNVGQQNAVLHGLEERLTLIQGPPGTGKSVTATVLARQIVAAADAARSTDCASAPPLGPCLLCCAPSNIAADQLAARLADTGANVIRIYAVSREEDPSYEPLPGALKVALHTKLGRDTADECQEGTSDFDKQVAMIAKADIVVTTCITALDRRVVAAFSAAADSDCGISLLIDEATQATEPELLVPACIGATHLVLIGDHAQLGPTVAARRAVSAGLAVPTFARLAALGVPVLRLSIQHRMHPAISAWPSQFIYNGLLSDGVTSAERRPPTSRPFPWPVDRHPNFFWHTVGSEETGPAGISFVNRTELAATRAAVFGLCAAGIKPADIAVITAYAAQRDLIAHSLRDAVALDSAEREVRLGEIEVASVDAFQGREKEVIVVSLVRSGTADRTHIGFLNDRRRVNVALTRARSGLILIGNATVLARSSFIWQSCVEHYAAQRSLVEGQFAVFRPAAVELNDESSEPEQEPEQEPEPERFDFSKFGLPTLPTASVLPSPALDFSQLSAWN